LNSVSLLSVLSTTIANRHIGQLFIRGGFFMASMMNNGMRGAICILTNVKTRGKTPSLAAGAVHVPSRREERGKSVAERECPPTTLILLIY